jgi:hypothetical protein
MLASSACFFPRTEPAFQQGTLAMAEILQFPAGRRVKAADCNHALPSHVEVLAADAGVDEWPEEDAPGGASLGLVASLAAAPSPTLVVLARKVEVLVARLATDEEADAGLCVAEASLLRSVLHDLRAFARDTAFGVQGNDAWSPNLSNC